MRTSFQICILSLVALIIGVAAPRVNAQCTGDVIPSGIIDGVDLAQMLSSWGPCTNCPADIVGDGAVNGNDLGYILAGWGPCAPFISSVAPGQGVIVGGTPITISGAFFTGVTSVTIGGAPVINMVVVSSTKITAVTPAHAAGSVSITITTSSRTSTFQNAFLYTNVPIVPSWATMLEGLPDPAVVTDANLRTAITATGLAWRVRDNGTNIQMLLVPAGTFLMGCSASSWYECGGGESTTHQVTLTQAFYIGRYEVTQAQWQAKMGSNPSYFADYPDSPSRPVETISWNMIQIFNTATGLRLPTEAEWEYAYRAGTTTAFHSFPGYPNGTIDDNLLGNIAWYFPTPGDGTHPVGGKSSNALGLHDMAGNISEWCQDWFSNSYYTSSPSTNPTGPLIGLGHVVRGGVISYFSDYCRASWRSYHAPDNQSYSEGFRAARNP